MVDLTAETPYELSWRPLLPYADREKGIQDDPEEASRYVFDRGAVDRGLFEQFQDQGDVLKRFPTTEECTKDKQFWKEESDQQRRAEEVVKSLGLAGPYDFFRVQPNSYNLSIQYEADGAAEEKRKKRAEKKMKKENALAGRDDQGIKDKLKKDRAALALSS